MSQVKRIMASILILIFIVGNVDGCAVSNGSSHISRGEFYAMFVENVNLYNDSYTIDDVDDYKKAEYRLYDRFC